METQLSVSQSNLYHKSNKIYINTEILAYW